MKALALETESLVLRSLLMSDAPGLVRAVQLSVETLSPYLHWASEHYDLEMARAFVRFAREGREKRREQHLGIFDRAGGEFIGMVGLMRIGAPVLGFEIGYWMRADREGRGLMTEAVRRLIAHAFEDLEAHRVWLNCEVRNRASRRVAEKLGMRREGRVKAFLIDAEGKPRDHYLYGLLKREFEG